MGRSRQADSPVSLDAVAIGPWGHDATPTAPRTLRATLVVLALGAIVWYAPLIGWGLPYATAPQRTKTFATDEILPLEALAEMRSTFVSAAPDRNFGYPWWHYFVVAAAQAPYVGALLISGDLSNPRPDYPFGFSDPVQALRVLTVIGRLVSVLMGAGIVIASFFFARAFWGDLAGSLAACLTLVSYPMTYYSRTGNLDVPAFFWSAIALAIFARVLTAGVTTRRIAWFAAFAAIGVATKDQSAALFVPMCLVLALPRVARQSDEPYRLRPLLIGVGVGLGAYVIATGMIVDPQRHVSHVWSLLFAPGRLTRGAVYFPPAPWTLAATGTLFWAFVSGVASMMALPVFVAAAAGFAIAVRSNRWHLIWLLPAVTIFVAFIRLPGNMVLRYVLPLTLFVDAFAAYALISCRRTRWRWAFAPGLAVLIASRGLASLDLSYAQWHDTRYPAAAWLREHYRPGDALEYFGVTETLPPLDSTVTSRRVMGREKWVGELSHGPAVLDYLRREGPAFLVVIPDWTSRPGMEHSADCPPEVYAALVEGSAGYRLAAYFAPDSLWPRPVARPRLDNPSVDPPVRIFVRSNTGGLDDRGASGRPGDGRE
jgi:hypothetical protein